jgi:uncharacterized protein
MDTTAIVHELLQGYVLSHRGIHGIVHWARVLENGLRLAEKTGANVAVVTLFALCHDCRRWSDGWDKDHGLRGAECALALRGSLIHLDDQDFDLLYEACRLHTDGHTQGDITIQTCWDADRLDLGRVGIRPRPARLCTDATRALIAWADERACSGYEPAFVREAWEL